MGNAMDMVDMGYTKSEMKDKSDESPSIAQNTPQYPWGLCIRLEQTELDKLGMKELPRIGQEFHMMAVGNVTGVNQNSKYSGDDSASVAIQIIGLQFMPEMPKKDAGKESMADENKEY